jgi:hypothetical protein
MHGWKSPLLVRPLSEPQNPASRPGIGRSTLFPGQIPDEPFLAHPAEARAALKLTTAGLFA